MPFNKYEDRVGVARLEAKEFMLSVTASVTGSTNPKYYSFETPTDKWVVLTTKEFIPNFAAGYVALFEDYMVNGYYILNYSSSGANAYTGTSGTASFVNGTASVSNSLETGSRITCYNTDRMGSAPSTVIRQDATFQVVGTPLWTTFVSSSAIYPDSYDEITLKRGARYSLRIADPSAGNNDKWAVNVRWLEL